MTAEPSLWRCGKTRSFAKTAGFYIDLDLALKGKSQRVSLQWRTHLKWAIAHCDGCVRVVVLTAEETQANPRVIRSCYPDDALVMKITHFDAKTGSFQACSVSRGVFGAVNASF
jgi:hypothetical protein